MRRICYSPSVEGFYKYLVSHLQIGSSFQDKQLELEFNFEISRIVEMKFEYLGLT